MSKVFISYSHVDESYRDELQKHLMCLQHQGIIESWHDRRIIPGEEWANRIDDELKNADIILLLISSDFISSSYCYELEMKEALARHERNEAVVIPVILRPCHWTGLPFGKLQAATKDGKPIDKYTSLDDAFLEITQNIEKVTKNLSVTYHKQSTASQPVTTSSVISQSTTVISELPRSSNLAIPKTFSDHDRDIFVIEAFNYIAVFFENSLKELQERNPEINTRFQKVNARSFEATIYRNGNQISTCGIWLGNSLGFKGSSSLMYSQTGLGQGNSFNESMSVNDNGNILGLEPLGISYMHQGKKELLTNQGAAEYYWSIFFDPIKQIHM